MNEKFQNNFIFMQDAYAKSGEDEHQIIYVETELIEVMETLSQGSDITLFLLFLTFFFCFAM